MLLVIFVVFSLKGQVGKTVQNIETTINNKITENNVVINKNIDTKIEANNTVINQNITNAITENNKTINNTINKVNVKVDGVKGDLDGLTKRVVQNEKDINVAGTIALENRKFIGDNKAAIDKNTKAIEALNGKVG